MSNTKKPLSLIFMGSPVFAVPTLNALIASGHRIRCVYTQPPRPAGRGQRERCCPVHAHAAALGIEVRTPRNFRNISDRECFAALNVDAVIVAAYGLLLPVDILTAPKLGCFNVHASLLPRWRGSAPIQRAILAGDRSSGVSIMAMEETLDTGAIYLREEVSIKSDMTAQHLHDLLAVKGGQLMVKALAGIAERKVKPVPQPDSGVTYAKKLDKTEGRIYWTNSSVDNERKVRALNPWPGAWFFHDGQRIKILAARLDSGKGQLGTVIKAPLYVACRDGSLCIERVQRSGKVPMEAAEFLRGHPIPVGTRLV